MRECLACSRKQGIQLIKGTVYECPKCGCLFSDGMYLGDYYEYVLPYMTTEDVPPERQRHYDFICLGSKGIERRHGWFDPWTKRIVQIG